MEYDGVHEDEVGRCGAGAAISASASGSCTTGAGAESSLSSDVEPWRDTEYDGVHSRDAGRTGTGAAISGCGCVSEGATFASTCTGAGSAAAAAADSLRDDLEPWRETE